MATVLVVDDEFGIAELFEAILVDEGHHVVTAINGRHGLEVLMQERVDLIFLDYMMPVMNGAAMLHAMAADPVLRRIPVVLMSSMTSNSNWSFGCISLTVRVGPRRGAAVLSRSGSA